jgi:hypothetical protein
MGVFSGVNSGLNFVGVDDSGDIGVGQQGSLELVSVLFNTSISLGSENVVQFVESAFGPDDESTQLTSGGEFQKVKSVDVNDANSWDISQSLV